MEGVPHNLPLQTTSFVGRQQEIREINELLADPRCRLLSLVGPGGVGKTRLALEVARGFVDPAVDTTASIVYPDGVYLVNLQPVAASDDIVTTIASAVGIQFYEPRDPEAELFRCLANRQALLILDNFEHLLAGVDFIEALLASVPVVDLLVTSRAALNMTQEWIYQVEGMTYPPDRFPASLETFGAVQLFAERARQVRHDFSLEDEGPRVVEICRLVEGMPLGIELAAAWLRRLSSNDIARELRRGLGILESEAHDLPNRHRSMRAVFDHSWELLSREEGQVLMKLSVFRGGFRREAAEYVAGASLQTLASLVDQSLIRLASNGRYEIHELQRQYAAERLAERPEPERDARDRHCQYFADVMDGSALNLVGRRGEAAIQVLEADIDNIRSGWNWAVQKSRIRDLHKSMETMYFFVWFRPWAHEIERAFRQAVKALRVADINEERDVALGQALSFLGALEIELRGTAKAQEKLQESLAILRRHSARRELAQATTIYADIAITIGADLEEARAMALEAVDLLDETDQYFLQGNLFQRLGWLAQSQGQYSESEKWYRKGLLVGQKTGHQRIVAINKMGLGSLARFLGEYAKAVVLLQESLAIMEELKLRRPIITLSLLGQVYDATGKIEQANAYLRESLAIARERGDVTRIVDSLVALGHLMSAHGEVERAAELYQEALHVNPPDGSPEYRLRALTGFGWIAFQSREYRQAREYHEVSLDLSRQFGDRRYIGNNLNGLGRVALAEGDMDLARQYFLAALRESLAIGAPPVIVDSLGNDAEMFRQEGDLALAARLATLVLNHSAAHYRTKQPAQRLLDQLAAEMPPEEFNIACLRNKSDALEPAAEEVAERLAAMDDQAALASQPQLDPLSERELEVLRLVALGKSNREIAAELTLALGTVKSHLHHIYQKLGVSSRTQAVARARELQLA